MSLIRFQTNGDEKIEVFAIWKTGQGAMRKEVETCNSTMDEIKENVDPGWRRFTQNLRERAEVAGISLVIEGGGVSATWVLGEGVLQKIPPGVLQVSLGTIVSKLWMQW